MNWFYSKDNQQAGPVDDAEFSRLVQTGAITDATLVWHSDLANWLPYGTVRASGPAAGGVATAAAAAPSPVAAVSGGAGTAVSLGKTVGAGQAQCSQCGRVLPADEVVQIGSANVCAECKPVFMQRMREGGVVAVKPYAGFGVRLGAALLDGVILIPLWVVYFGVVFMVLLPQISAANSQDTGTALGFQVLNLVMSLGLQLILAAYSAFCVSRYGGTPGKRICKLRVIRGDGSARVTFWRAVGRYFSKAFISKIFFVGYIFIIFDEQKRGLHDMICDTRVVHEG